MSFSSKVLVDSSIWIDFFRSSRESVLTNLIEANLVCTNELILTELIPFAKHLNQHNLVEGLLAIEAVPLNIDWEGLRMLQVMNIQHGINKVGIPALIIAQQVLSLKMEFWSLDKHFGLMSKFLDLNLYRV